MSFAAAAEVYNKVMVSSGNSNAQNLQIFLQQWPFKLKKSEGRYQEQSKSSSEVRQKLVIIADYLSSDCEDAVTGGLNFLHRKTVAETFWNVELEEQLRQRGRSPVIERK